MLLQTSANTELQDNEGSTALHKAFENENISILLAFLNRETKIKARNKEDATFLHEATVNENFDSVRLLLDREVDSFATDRKSFSSSQSVFVNGFETLEEDLRGISRSTE